MLRGYWISIPSSLSSSFCHKWASNRILFRCKLRLICFLHYFSPKPLRIPAGKDEPDCIAWLDCGFLCSYGWLTYILSISPLWTCSNFTADYCCIYRIFYEVLLQPCVPAPKDYNSNIHNKSSHLALCPMSSMLWRQVSAFFLVPCYNFRTVEGTTRKWCSLGTHINT
jgi:hypothetical protein